MNHLSQRIIEEPARVESFLRRLFGLSPSEVEGVAKAIYRAFVQVSALHPKGFNGTSAWAEGSASLRSVLLAKGWMLDDPQNQPRVVSKNGKLAITVSSGNAYAGVADKVPQTRNDKGSQTAASVDFNARQLPLFLVDAKPKGPITIHQDGQSLWILLYYIDFENRELRYELSRPTGMADNDKVNGWSVRLIFKPMSFEPESFREAVDELPEIDIAITPKT